MFGFQNTLQNTPQFHLKERLEKATTNYVEMVLEKSENRELLTFDEYNVLLRELCKITDYRTPEQLEQEQKEQEQKLMGLVSAMAFNK